jgi:hypothetical protein
VKRDDRDRTGQVWQWSQATFLVLGFDDRYNNGKHLKFISHAILWLDDETMSFTGGELDSCLENDEHPWETSRGRTRIV